MHIYTFIHYIHTYIYNYNILAISLFSSLHTYIHTLTFNDTIDEEDIKAMNKKYASIPDFTIVRPEKPDISDIPADAFVTDEDTKSLKRAHR